MDAVTPAAGTHAAGLTGAEVAERRAQGLGNEEQAPSSRSLRQIVRTNVFTRFNAILATLMAVIIVVGPFQDGLFGIVLVLNTLIGIGQEVRAKRTLDRLAVLSAPRVTAVRDGVPEPVTTADLVVDDLIVLARGDQVPLDGVVDTGVLEVDESLLSGESDPVARGPGAPVLSGSFVTSGAGVYRVTTVGADSYAQRIAGEARRFTLASSELRDGVDRFLQFVQWALIPVSIALIVSQLLSHQTVADAIRGCVAGVSAMIPEGLILLTSVAFAVAVVRLARKRVLVQELPAVEGLARVDVLCLDKTGTLTRGGIHAEDLAVIRPQDAERAAAALGALAGAESNPNPTLGAIAARWPDIAWPATATVPFSSARKWSAGDFAGEGVWVLGAPDVLGAGPLAERVVAATGQGRRVVMLARAIGPLHDDVLPAGLEPVALVTLVEDIRPDAAQTLEYFRAQGVAVKVFSGDHPRTVAAIAAAVGLPGADVPVDAGSVGDEELIAALAEHTVFGRVSPHQKRTMVQALKAAGHTVAMTGDGVNDVLALKDADIGVAMGSGSAATRGVAQLILLDDAFSALPPVIAEGRRVIANVERVANLFITKTVYATLIAFVIGVTASPYPFLPRHLTIISDFTIGIPAFFLALLPNDRPFRPGFVGRVLQFTLPAGAVVAAAALVAYFAARAGGLPLVDARTNATIVVVAVGLYVLVLVSRPLVSIKAVIVAAMAACFAAMLFVPRVRRFFALSIPPARYVAGSAVIVVVAVGVLEAAYRWRRSASGLAP